VGKQLMWVAVGGLVLVLVGALVLKIVGALLKFLITALVVLALVGGGIYLLDRAKSALSGRRSRQIR
jgi:hypothetical protein